MCSLIEIDGYGYSKRLCEDVSSWFLNKYLSRYKIYLLIQHRGLKRENSFGFCDVMDGPIRPREFLIELHTYMDKETYIKTLLHELYHVKQWVTGDLQVKAGRLVYQGMPFSEMFSPHEAEAYQQEEILYEEYQAHAGSRNQSKCS